MPNTSPSAVLVAESGTQVDRYECTFVVDINGNGDFTNAPGLRLR